MAETLGLELGIFCLPLTMLCLYSRSTFSLREENSLAYCPSLILEVFGTYKLLIITSCGRDRPEIAMRRSEVEVIPSLRNNSRTSSLVGSSSN